MNLVVSCSALCVDRIILFRSTSFLLAWNIYIVDWPSEEALYAEPERRPSMPKKPFVSRRPSVLKGSMPPSIGHMELLLWMQRADFSEHIQGFKSPGDPLNSSHFDAPNTKSAPTGYRRAPNIISHHYKQQLSVKASIVPKARPIRFR